MFRAQAERWAEENAGELWIDRDEHGRPVVLKADPIVAINVDWFMNHGWRDIFTDDGIVIGDARYRWMRDLPDGSTAYQRIDN